MDPSSRFSTHHSGVRHLYLPSTPHLSYVFALAASLRRRLPVGNDSFADTGRSNSADTPRFISK